MGKSKKTHVEQEIINAGISETTIPVEVKVADESEYVQVDKLLFFKEVERCVKGHGCTGTTAVVRFGEMQGAKTFAEQKKLWDEIQEYLRKAK